MSPPRHVTSVADAAAQVQSLARPLHGPGDLDPLIEQVGAARFVCLGEASHGTHEFYRWRALLSRRLIVERGFTWIGVEGDWPDCWRINRWVRGLDEQTYFDVWDGTRWSGWTSLGGSSDAAPEPVAFGSELFVFVRGTDQGLYSRVFDGSTWSGAWTPLGGHVGPVSAGG